MLLAHPVRMLGRRRAWLAGVVVALAVSAPDAAASLGLPALPAPSSPAEDAVVSGGACGSVTLRVRL